MKSSGVLATLMLAAVAGYASAGELCTAETTLTCTAPHSVKVADTTQCAAAECAAGDFGDSTKVCCEAAATCDASALISTSPAATGANDCTSTQASGVDCTQVMAGGTCTASTCVAGTPTPGVCTATVTYAWTVSKADNAVGYACVTTEGTAAITNTRTTQCEASNAGGTDATDAACDGVGANEGAGDKPTALSNVCAAIPRTCANGASAGNPFVCTGEVTNKFAVADGTTECAADGGACTAAVCCRIGATCTANSLSTAGVTATGAGTCTATQASGVDCTQVLAAGTCAVTTCTDGTVGGGVCALTTEDCSAEDTLECTGPAVLDSTGSCAGAACAAGDFGDNTKACCKDPPTTCDASALISTTPAATGAGDCDATLDDTTSCTQVMAGGTCTASSCAGTTLTPGTCTAGAACSTLSAGACTGTAVKDAGTKTCAADPCVDGTDFTDKDSNCCKAKPPAPATTTSGAATAAVSLTALLALVLA